MLLGFAIEPHAYHPVRLLIIDRLGTQLGHGGMQVDGKTPLHYAAERGVQATVRALLDKGGSAVMADGQGRLPQHLASGKIQTLLLKEAEKQGGSPFKHRSMLCMLCCSTSGGKLLLRCANHAVSCHATCLRACSCAGGLYTTALASACDFLFQLFPTAHLVS